MSITAAKTKPLSRQDQIDAVRGLLTDIRAILTNALDDGWLDDVGEYKLSEEICSLEAVTEQLNEVAKGDQPIHLRVFKDWHRIARRDYLERSPDVVEVADNPEHPCDVIDLKHYLSVTSASQEVQATLQNIPDGTLPQDLLTPLQKSIARSLIIDHVAYSTDEDLIKILSFVGIKLS